MPDGAPTKNRVYVTTEKVVPAAAGADRITLRFLAGPGDVTVAGNAVPAGRVLEWIDKAAYACAVGWSGGYCVTAFVGDVNFTQPVRPGDLIEVHARIVLTGNSSMHILVSVESSEVHTRRFRPAMHCLLVMVALDDEGAPRQVPVWQPWSDGDITLQRRTSARIEPRRTIQEVMQSETYSDGGSTPRTVFRFLASPRDANWGGNAHGGTVLSWIDETAYTCAASWSSENAVAVYSGGIHFLRPIAIGNIVEVDARLIHTGEHSMHVSVHVRSGPAVTPHKLELTTQCLSVFVVPGEDGHATRVNPLPLLTPEDIRLDEHARKLIGLRESLSIIPIGLTREG